MWITPRHIVVADRKHARAVFVFDRQGRFETVIDRSGNGPEEYADMADATLTPDRKRIVILSSFERKLLFFDLSGAFLYSKTLPFCAWRIKYTDDNELLANAMGLGSYDSTRVLSACCRSTDLAFFVDSAMQVRGSSVPNLIGGKIVFMNIPDSYVMPGLYEFGDHVYLHPAYSDTVYRVAAGEMIPRYRIDLEGIGGKANLGHDLTDQNLESAIETDALFTGEFVENDRYALFRINDPKRQIPRVVLFSEKDRKSYDCSVEPDDFLQRELLRARFSYRDRFVAAVPAFQVCASELSQQNRDGLSGIKDGLTDDSNPVLLFFSLKDPAPVQ